MPYYTFSVEVCNDNTNESKLLLFSIEFESQEDWEHYCEVEDPWLDILPPFVNQRLIDLNMPWRIDDCIEPYGKSDVPLEVHLHRPNLEN